MIEIHCAAAADDDDDYDGDEKKRKKNREVLGSRKRVVLRVHHLYLLLFVLRVAVSHLSSFYC